jgi:hypothetical protein
VPPKKRKIFFKMQGNSDVLNWYMVTGIKSSISCL